MKQQIEISEELYVNTILNKIYFLHTFKGKQLRKVVH